jgi:hypothetical protein
MLHAYERPVRSTILIIHYSTYWVLPVLLTRKVPHILGKVNKKVRYYSSTIPGYIITGIVLLHTCVVDYGIITLRTCKERYTNTLRTRYAYTE